MLMFSHKRQTQHETVNFDSFFLWFVFFLIFFSNLLFMKPLYYLLGGLAALWAYSYFKLAKSINFTFKKIGFSGGLIKPKINITLGLQNPSSQSAKLTSIAGNVYLNDKYFANFSNFISQDINANSESDILLIASPNLLGTANIIRDFIKNRGKGKIIVKLEGTANIDGNSIKFEQTQIV